MVVFRTALNTVVKRAALAASTQVGSQINGLRMERRAVGFVFPSGH